MQTETIGTLGKLMWPNETDGQGMLDILATGVTLRTTPAPTSLPLHPPFGYTIQGYPKSNRIPRKRFIGWEPIKQDRPQSRLNKFEKLEVSGAAQTLEQVFGYPRLKQ